MKYSFLKSKPSVVIIGLALGLVVGFKVANSQYRREQAVTLNNAAARAASQMKSGEGGGENLTPEQRDKIINDVKAIIDKAKSNPQDVEAQLDAADQFIQINRPEESIQFLEQANKVKPSDARTSAGLGMAYFMLGKYEDAISWSKRSLEVTPKNPGASFLLVASYIRTNQKLNEAEKMIAQLEADGVDQEMVAKAREELNLAKSGKNTGVNASPKSVLDHGPQAPTPNPNGPGGAQSGGRQ